MARITLEFTEEQIKVIRCLRFNKLSIKHERKELVNTIKEIGALVDSLDPDPDEERDTLTSEQESTHSICEMIRSGLNEIYTSAIRSKEIAADDSDKYYGLDLFDLFNGITPFELVAYALGMQDKAIVGTEEDPDGVKYPDDVMKKFREILDPIYHDIVDIEDLIHQRCDKGGIQAGVKYIALDRERIWYTEEEFKERYKK